MDKLDRDGTYKTKRLYECGFNHALAKDILDNEFEYLWRRENPDYSDFTHCNRWSATKSRRGRTYTDIIIAENIKINDIMVSFTDHQNASSLKRLPSQTKIEKD